MSKSKRGYTRRAFMVLGGAAVGASTLTGTARADNHPYQKIHAAIDALKEARDFLQHAKHNFGGHKKEAVEHINGALKHLNLCLDN